MIFIFLFLFNSVMFKFMFGLWFAPHKPHLVVFKLSFFHIYAALVLP